MLEVTRILCYVYIAHGSKIIYKSIAIYIHLTLATLQYYWWLPPQRIIWHCLIVCDQVFPPNQSSKYLHWQNVMMIKFQWSGAYACLLKSIKCLQINFKKKLYLLKYNSKSIDARTRTRTVLVNTSNSDQGYREIFSNFGQEFFYWSSNVKNVYLKK